MFYSYYSYQPSPYLYHSGIKGMKWGLRRYQNPDGTLTEAGKKRYARAYKGAVAYYKEQRFAKKASSTPYEARRYQYNDKVKELQKKQRTELKGLTQKEIEGARYIVAKDRNTAIRTAMIGSVALSTGKSFLRGYYFTPVTAAIAAGSAIATAGGIYAVNRGPYWNREARKYKSSVN